MVWIGDLGVIPSIPNRPLPYRHSAKNDRKKTPQLKLLQEVISYLKCLGPEEFQILLIYLLGVRFFFLACLNVCVSISSANESQKRGESDALEQI